MSETTFEVISSRVSEALNSQIKEFSKTIEDIVKNFRNLGLGVAVWHPEKIHTANLGGIDTESYIGYSRVEGKWGLIIRTIERDHASHAFISQRVYTIESCGNVEIQVNGLRKVRELLQLIAETGDRQIKVLAELGGVFEELRNPNFGTK